jgi:hypothetical protein
MFPLNLVMHVLNLLTFFKEALFSIPIIQYLDWSLPFKIMCDATEYVVGAVLGQTKDRKHHTIAYASKTLIGAQLNYTTTKKTPSCCFCY